MRDNNLYSTVMSSFSRRLEETIKENEKVYGDAYDIISYDDNKALFLSYKTCALYEYAEPERLITRVDFSASGSEEKARDISKRLVEAILEDTSVDDLILEYQSLIDERVFFMRLPIQGIFSISESDRKKIFNILMENSLFVEYLSSLGNNFKKNDKILFEAMPFLGLRSREKMIKFFRDQIGLTYEQAKIITNGLLNVHLGQHLSERFDFKNLFRSVAGYLPPDKSRKLTLTIMETITEATISDPAKNADLKPHAGKEVDVTADDIKTGKVKGVTEPGKYPISKTGKVVAKVNGKDTEVDITVDKTALKEDNDEVEDFDTDADPIPELDSEEVDQIEQTESEVDNALQDAKELLTDLLDSKEPDEFENDDEIEKLENAIKSIDNLLSGGDVAKDSEEEQEEETMEDGELVGGLGDDVPFEDLDPEELEMGTEEEKKEHLAGNEDISDSEKDETARDIARDHLAEDPKYYSKLKKMEGSEDNTETTTEEDLESDTQPEEEDSSIEKEKDDFTEEDLLELPPPDEMVPEFFDDAQDDNTAMTPEEDLVEPDMEQDDLPDISANNKQEKTNLKPMENPAIENDEAAPESYTGYADDSDILIGDQYTIEESDEEPIVDTETNIPFAPGSYTVIDIAEDTVTFIDDDGNKFYADKSAVLVVGETYSPIKEEVLAGDTYELPDSEANTEKQVKDKNTGEALPFGLYLITSKKEEGVTLTFVDDDGRTTKQIFTIPLAALSAFLKVETETTEEDDDEKTPDTGEEDSEDSQKEFNESILEEKHKGKGAPPTPFEKEASKEVGGVPDTPFESDSKIPEDDIVITEPKYDNKASKTGVIQDKSGKKDKSENIMDFIPEPADDDLVSDLPSLDLEEPAPEIPSDDFELPDENTDNNVLDVFGDTEKGNNTNGDLDLEVPDDLETPMEDGEVVEDAGDAGEAGDEANVSSEEGSGDIEGQDMDMSDIDSLAGGDALDTTFPEKGDSEAPSISDSTMDLDSSNEFNSELNGEDEDGFTGTEDSTVENEEDINNAGNDGNEEIPVEDEKDIPSTIDREEDEDTANLYTAKDDPTGKFSADPESQFLYDKLDNVKKTLSDIQTKADSGKKDDSGGGAYQKGIEAKQYLDLTDALIKKLEETSDESTKEQVKQFLSFFVPEEELESYYTENILEPALASGDSPVDVNTQSDISDNSDEENNKKDEENQ